MQLEMVLFRSTESLKWAFGLPFTIELNTLAVPVGAIGLVVWLFFLKVPKPCTPLLAGLKAIDWTRSILIFGGASMDLLALELGVISLTVAGTVAFAVSLLNE